MSNTLSVYDPIFYAQEALIQLEKALGMAGVVHRGYDKNPQEQGSTISIARPSTFTAQDAPNTASNVTASKVDITLNKWKEVRFSLSDKELAFTKEKIITDHIRPAAYAIADQIDQDIAGLYKDVSGYYGTAATTPSAVTDLTGVRKLLQDSYAPDDGNRFLMVDSAAEAKFLELAAFNNNGSSQKTDDVLIRGMIGDKFGMKVFQNQNTPLHTKGSVALTTPVCTAAVGDTSVTITGTGGSGTYVAGDIIAIGTYNGATDYYSVLTGGTQTSTTATIVLAQPIRATKTGATVTLPLGTHRANMAFHRNAFALATAPLSEMASQLGQKVATTNYNGLALRSRMYADGANSAIVVVVDCLYGVKTLDERLAKRLLG